MCDRIRLAGAWTIVLALWACAPTSHVLAIDPPQTKTTGSPQAATPALAKQFMERIQYSWNSRRGEGLQARDIQKWVKDGQIDPKALRDSLLALLKHPDDRERFAAANLLGLLGDRGAVPDLIFALRKDADSSVRREACRSIGLLGPAPGAEVALVGALSDPEEMVRYAAVWSLGSNKAYKNEFLREAAKNNSNRLVRVRAADALTARGERDDEIVNVFREGLKHESTREESESALEGLKKLILPLPENYYQPITRETYLKYQRQVKTREGLELRQSVEIQRTATKDGKTYFELVDTHFFDPAFPARIKRSWFVAPAEKKSNQ